MKKRCKKCNCEKDLSDFHKEKGNSDGLRSDCKTCRCRYMSDFYQHNKEAIVGYREDNKIRINACRCELYSRVRSTKFCTCCSRKDVIQFYIDRPSGLTVDHVHPTSKGGAHCLKNMQYLTPQENAKKGGKLNG